MDYKDFSLGPDLQLKQFRIEDAVAMNALIDKNRRRLRMWLPWLDQNLTLEDTQRFILSTIDQDEKGFGFQCAIWFEGKIVGTIGYHPIDKRNKKTAIGYWLDSEAEGRGIMTKCVDYFVKYAFNELKLNKITVRAASSNEKSKAIPQRLGFIYEGKLLKEEWLYDHFVDHEIYSLFNEKFSYD